MPKTVTLHPTVMTASLYMAGAVDNPLRRMDTHMSLDTYVRAGGPLLPVMDAFKLLARYQFA